MKYNNKIVIGIGIAVIAAVLAVAATAVPQYTTDNSISFIPKRVLTLQTGQTGIPEAEAAATCGQSLVSVKAQAPFPVRTPTVLPQGYSLKSIEYSEPGRIYAKFSDGDVCGGTAMKLKDGVIELVAGPLSSITDAKTGQQYTESEAQKYHAAGQNATTYKFANGMYAVGYPAGVGTSRAIDENNVVVHTEQFDYAADIWVVDDGSGTVYRLTAYLPMEDMVKIAESLK